MIAIGIGAAAFSGCKGGEDLEIGQSEIGISDGNDAEDGIIAQESDMSGTNEGSDILQEEDDDTRSEIEQIGVKPEPEQDGTSDDSEVISKEIPRLPETGRDIADFVPEGWELLDSAALDFNEDGITDYIGVLDASLMDEDGDFVYQGYPRILFAIAGDSAGGYCLDFQDVNLIRTRDEGGMWGDPYIPLTAEKTSFSTHAFGGSAWNWSEEYTYIYRGGDWWLDSSETMHGYQDYITSYEKDDWESGIGIRKKRSSEFEDMEKRWDAEGYDTENYDVEYELPLDDRITLEQAGKRWWLAPDRVTEWEVDKIVIAEGVKLSEDMVKLPGKNNWYWDYCDEDCVLYVFYDEDKRTYYLAIYRCEDKTLSVIAEETTKIDNSYLNFIKHYEELKHYKGKIYYAADIVENVAYREVQDGKEQIVEKEAVVGIRIDRMNLDGTGKETVFVYRLPQAQQEILEGHLPYLYLKYEISGDEIVAEICIGNEPHPLYRMNTDGSGQKMIGQIPKE